LKSPTRRLATATMPRRVWAVSLEVSARTPQTTAASARFDNGPTTATNAVVVGELRVAS
jgi:hypothetical protein